MDITNPQRAKVLVHALPYIQEYSGKIVVIKYGGNAMISAKLKDSVMRDIVLLSLIGVKVVLVHGGGPEITETLEKLGKQTQFVDGLRVTDAETADVVQMVLAGKINKTLVNLIGHKGGRAIGLSGIDGQMIQARVRDERLGYVGEITSNLGTDIFTIRCLLFSQFPLLFRNTIVCSSASRSSIATPSSGRRNHILPLPSRLRATAPN